MPFKSDLILRESKISGYWVTTEDLTYVSNVGVEYTVPKGFATDLASIPFGFKNFFNQNDNTRSPAVLHDWLYKRSHMLRSSADELFYEAMISRGVNKVKAYSMYLAVRMFGWRYYKG